MFAATLSAPEQPCNGTFGPPEALQGVYPLVRRKYARRLRTVGMSDNTTVGVIFNNDGVQRGEKWPLWPRRAKRPFLASLHTIIVEDDTNRSVVAHPYCPQASGIFSPDEGIY